MLPKSVIPPVLAPLGTGPPNPSSRRSSWARRRGASAPHTQMSSADRWSLPRARRRENLHAGTASGLAAVGLGDRWGLAQEGPRRARRGTAAATGGSSGWARRSWPRRGVGLSVEVQTRLEAGRRAERRGTATEGRKSEGAPPRARVPELRNGETGRRRRRGEGRGMMGDGEKECGKTTREGTGWRDDRSRRRGGRARRDDQDEGRGGKATTVGRGRRAEIAFRSRAERIGPLLRGGRRRVVVRRAPPR